MMNHWCGCGATPRTAAAQALQGNLEVSSVREIVDA
jgi:hypothetical protein